MASPGVQGPQLSPDGHWWWDGQAWQPVQVPASPVPVPAVVPTPAPMPAPAPEPSAQKPEWLDQPPSWLATPPGVAAAEPAAPPEAAYMPEPVPAWQQPPPRSAGRPLFYVAAALLIAVLAGGGFAIRGQLLGNLGGGNPASQVTPTPLLSDYERADRFLNVDLGPSLTETEQALPGVQSSCTSSLPPPCKDALMRLDKAMVDVQDAITKNQRDIPPCIGPQVDQLKSDWNGMEQGVSQAIQGYQANSRDLIVQGFQKFASIAQFLTPDINRINAAEQTCKK